MDKRLYLAGLLAVVLFALAARTFLYHWENIFGIDSYWFARMGRYALVQGDVPDRDPLYSWSFEHAPIKKELTMYLPAWYYRLRFGEEYNKTLWFLALKDLSAAAGAAGSLASALMAAALGGPLAGILAGIFAGTNPGYVYRSMAGFYEDDAWGMAFILIGAWLFVEGMRRRRWKWLFYGLAGLAWLGVAVGWEVYELVVYVLAMTILLFIGRHVLDIVRPYLPKQHTHLALLAVIGSLLLWFAWRMLALQTAKSTLETVGFLTTNINSVGAATLLVLGLHPLVVVFMSLFAFYLTLFLIERERKYLYIALGAFLLSIPFYIVTGQVGFRMSLEVGGREVFIGYGQAFDNRVPGVDLYQAIFGTIAVIFTVHVLSSFLAMAVAKERTERSKLKEMVAAALLVLAIGSLALFYNGYNWLSDIIVKTGLLEQRTNVVGATVVEERYGYYFWAPKYSFLALIPLFAVPFIVRRSHRPEYLFLLALFGITLYLAWIKLKTCYYFGAPLGIVAGLVLHDIVKEVREERIRKALWAFLLILALASLATGIFHTVGRIPTLLTEEEVKEASLLTPIASDLEWRKGPEYLSAFAFIEANTEKNAPIFNWWGVGHWLTFFTERPVVTDNTNKVFKANRFVARMFLSDWNEAYREIKERGFKYVFWIRDYAFAPSVFLLYRDGFGGLSKASEYVLAVSGECRKTTVANYYNCGTDRPFFVDASIVERAPPLLLAPLPFDYLPKIQGTYGVYRLGNRLVVVSEKINKSLLFLLWKGGNEHFVPVYVSQNGLIVVYRIE